MQVMTSGQSVSFEFLGTNYTFTVNQAMVEGQEKDSIDRGIISKETYIVFAAASNSGIKVVLCSLCSFLFLLMHLLSSFLPFLGN